MRELIAEIHALLREGEPATLATIVRHQGSTPRTSGAGMVVRRDGTIAGTIGGGRVEGVVIGDALRLFESGGAILARYDLTAAGDMDLVCGGAMQVVIEHVAPDSGNLALFGLLHEELLRGNGCLWLGKMVDAADGLRLERAVRTSGKKWHGSLAIPPPLQKMLADPPPGQAATTLFDWDGASYLATTIDPAETLCLLGAGHVSQQIARLTGQLGFRTLVFDDRADFADPARFPEAAGVFVCDDFATLFATCPIPTGSYIVIVTRGHRHDKEVLAQALRSKAAYIGMIGSRKKRESVYRDLRQEGFDQQALDQVHCPVGLAIDAETPAEIAISVAAELIRHRAGRHRHG